MFWIEMEFTIQRRVISINLSALKHEKNPYQVQINKLSIDQLYTIFDQVKETDSLQLIGAALLHIQ